MLNLLLRELRETKGVSRQELADALGLKNAQTIKFWELGYRDPSEKRLRAICAFYGISMSELYKSETEVCK
jgi:transcriptional regulator with XRE-family HTH domain